MSQRRVVRTLAVALLLGSAAAAGAQAPSPYVASIEDILVPLAVADFASNGPAADGFRNVTLQYRETDTGARTYMICGQVRIRSGANTAWEDFATIRTAPYEQWIGTPAAEVCTQGTPVAGGRDLASVLDQALLANVSGAKTP